MTTNPAQPEPSPQPQLSRRAARVLDLLRVLISLHVVLIFGQPVFAGLYLSGDYDSLNLHALGADLVSYLSYLQLLVALVLWLVKGPRWLFAASLLLTLGETAQYFAGLAGALDLHLPLGVALITGAALLTVAAWRPQSSPRPKRRARAEHAHGQHEAAATEADVDGTDGADIRETVR